MVDRRSARTLQLAVAVASATAGTMHATPASAVDVELSATTAGQSYDVASPWGYRLERRRLLQTVGFSLYHLQGDSRPGEPDYNLRLLGRVDADFGIGNHLPSNASDAETTYDVARGSYFVPGLAIAKFDLMYGYIEGRNLAGGYLGFKAGRQYVTDALGWWSFDGGLFRVSTPFYVDVEVYGGLEQRGGLPLSTSRYEAQGVWRGDHAGFDEDGGPRSSDYPSYQFAAVAPAFGAAIESAGPNWLHARLTYRRVYNTGEAFTSQFPVPAGGGYPTVDGLRISSEKVGWSGYVNKTDFGGAKGGFSYDVYNQTFATAYGGVEVYAGEQVTIGADADHYRPTFDADSIFNWFTHQPSTTATGRVAVRFTKEIDLAASGGAKLWSTEGDPEELGSIQCRAVGQPKDCHESAVIDPSSPDPSTPDGTGLRLTDVSRNEDNRGTAYDVDGLGQLAARYASTQGSIELRSMVQAGERGHRVGGDAGGQKLFDGGRYALGGRLSIYDFTDPRAEDDHTTSFGYVIGGGYKPIDITRIGAEWEHDINARVGQRFRVLARLDVLWVR
jgi:hypothetical protein